MQTTLTRDELVSYVDAQLSSFFPDGRGIEKSASVKAVFDEALDRAEECFKHVLLRGYSRDGKACFNHLHGDQYSQFLYFLSNSWYHAELDPMVCQKLLNLNRSLNSIFVSYKLDLPPHFLFGHAIGTILGNATYGDCFVVFQNVTINTGKDGTDLLLPVIGKGAFLGAGCMLLGCEPVGDRVSLGANTFIINQAIPSDSVVQNIGGESIVKPRKHPQCFAQNYFDIPL